MSKVSSNYLTFYLHKRFFSATTQNISNNVTKLNTNAFTVEYLMNSCGLSEKSAYSAAKRIHLDEKNRPKYDSVLHYLRTNEFSNTHLVRLVEKQPLVLFCRISANLEPKFKFLTDNGVPVTVIPKIFVSLPNMILRNVDAQLKPVMSLLKEYISCPERRLVAIVRGAWIFNCDIKKILMPNVEFLLKQGMSRSRLGDLFATQPRCLYAIDVEKMVNAVNMIKSMGIMPSQTKFIYALRVVLSLSESSWKRKVEVFESMGWSYDEVIATFVSHPLCLSLSEKKLRSAMDFLVNTVKLEPKIVIGYPKILGYSLEKRMVPRYTIWKILKERGLIQNTAYVWVLNKSDKIFIDEHITKFSDEVPHLRMIYDQNKKLGRVYA